MASKHIHQKAFRASTVKTALKFVDPKTEDIILTKFDSLMEENRNAESYRMSHLRSSILPAIAVYQGCRESNIDKDISYRIAHTAMMETCRRPSRVMSLFGKLPFSYAVLRKVLPGFLSRTYDNRLWNFSWKQNDKDSVRVDAASCPYFEACVHYGVPELGAIFCEGDDKSFGNMKHVGWGRTKTLAKGGDLCDFCFYKR